MSKNIAMAIVSVILIAVIVVSIYQYSKNKAKSANNVSGDNVLSKFTEYTNYTDNNFVSISVKYKGKIVTIGNKNFKSIVLSGTMIAESPSYTSGILENPRIQIQDYLQMPNTIQVMPVLPDLMPNVSAGYIQNMSMAKCLFGVWYKATIPGSNDSFDIMFNKGSSVPTLAPATLAPATLAPATLAPK